MWAQQLYVNVPMYSLSRLRALFNLSTGTWGKMPSAPSNPRHLARWRTCVTCESHKHTCSCSHAQPLRRLYCFWTSSMFGWQLTNAVWHDKQLLLFKHFKSTLAHFSFIQVFLWSPCTWEFIIHNSIILSYHYLLYRLFDRGMNAFLFQINAVLFNFLLKET